MEAIPLRLSPVVSHFRLLLLLFTILKPWLVSPFTDCEDFVCGKYVFGYPFGRNNSGCGDLSLQLQCDNDGGKPKPVLDICGKKYYILRPQVYHSQLSDKGDITIIDKKLEDNCDPSSNKYTELCSGSQFHIADGCINIILLGQCGPEFIDLPHEMATLECNPQWHYNLTSGLSWPKICKARVVLPVENLGVPVDKDQILHGGFPIKWNVSESCKDCQLSGGLCAYDSSSMQFHCKCRDIPYPDSCPTDKSRTKISTVLGCAVGAVALVAVTVLYFLSIYMKRKRPQPRLEACRLGNMNLSIFSYEELQQATNFFDEKNKLGDGGFGSVYLAKLMDGRTVAVKRLYQDNSKRVEQFMNEIQILSSLHHPNLVSLYGYSCRDSPALLLVYEFVANGTLADHLHGNRRTSEGLAWETRLNIAIETAQALAFLHSLDPPIFHRDITSTNILLHENFRAKVADFGLSMLVPVNVSHVTTAQQGTPGYVDPDYHECFQLTGKSDVYSFGVVLVEIVSGKVAMDTARYRTEMSLANMALDKIRRGVLDELIDPDLRTEKNQDVKLMVSAVVELAFGCLATDRDVRPDMKEVAARLEEIKQLQEIRAIKEHQNSLSIESTRLTIDVI